MKKVYLAGAIYETADPLTWRKEVIRSLPQGWLPVDPTAFEVRGLVPDQLVELDLKHILTCHAVIARAFEASWGTAMEIRFSKENRIPVIAWVKDANAPQPPWLTAHVFDFADSINDIREILEIL